MQIIHRKIFTGDSQKCGAYIGIARRLLEELHRMRSIGNKLTQLRRDFEAGAVTIIVGTLPIGHNWVAISAQGGTFDVIFRLLQYGDGSSLKYYGYDTITRQLLASSVYDVLVSGIMPVVLDNSYLLMTHDNRAGTSFMSSHSTNGGGGYYSDPSMLLFETILTKSGKFMAASSIDRPSIDKEQPEYSLEDKWYQNEDGVGTMLNLYGTGLMEGGQGVHWMLIDHDFPYNTLANGEAMLIRRDLAQSDKRYMAVYRCTEDSSAPNENGLFDYTGDYPLAINPSTTLWNSGGGNKPTIRECKFLGGSLAWDRLIGYARRGTLFMKSDYHSFYTYPNYPDDDLTYIVHYDYQEVWRFGQDGSFSRQFGIELGNIEEAWEDTRSPVVFYGTDYPGYKISSFLTDFTSSESGFLRLRQLRVGLAPGGGMGILPNDKFDLFVSSNPDSMEGLIDQPPKLSFQLGDIIGYGDRQANKLGTINPELESFVWRISENHYGFICVNGEGPGSYNLYKDAIFTAKTEDNGSWTYDVVYAPEETRSLGYATLTVDSKNHRRVIITETDRPTGGNSTRKNFVVYVIDVITKEKIIVREHENYFNEDDPVDRAANQIRFV